MDIDQPLSINTNTLATIDIPGYTDDVAEFATYTRDNMPRRSTGTYSRFYDVQGREPTYNKDGIPAVIPTPMTLCEETIASYVAVVRMAETQLKLMNPVVMEDDMEQSDILEEPVLDTSGNQINTPEYLKTLRLLTLYHRIAELQMQYNPAFVPPEEYVGRPHLRYMKLYLKEYTNKKGSYIGLLIGPRGKSQRELEELTNSKISIRGQGSARPGRGRRDGRHNLGEHEPLHCKVETMMPEDISKAFTTVIEVLRPKKDNENDWKLGQMRELAKIQGIDVNMHNSFEFEHNNDQNDTVRNKDVTISDNLYESFLEAASDEMPPWELVRRRGEKKENIDDNDESESENGNEEDKWRKELELWKTVLDNFHEFSEKDIEMYNMWKGWCEWENGEEQNKEETNDKRNIIKRRFYEVSEEEEEKRENSEKDEERDEQSETEFTEEYTDYEEEK